MALNSWLLLLVIVMAVGAVGKMPWLVAFSVAVFFLLGLAEIWNRAALKDVVYRRRWVYRRGFPGEKLDIQVDVENNKLLPLAWLRVSDPWPKLVGPEDESILAATHVPTQGELVSLYSLRWFQRATRTYRLLLRQRGVYPVGPAVMEAGDLFGIFTSQKPGENSQYITVFPDLTPVARLGLPADDPFGDRAARKRLFEDINRPIGVRDYHPEDGFRRIHWPASARTGALQAKVYQPVTSQVMAVCLNVTTAKYHWLGTSPELLEYLVKVCATLVYQGVQDGYAVGLYSNGCLAHADQPFRIAPGRSAAHLGVLLQALAGVTSFVSGTFEAFMIRALPQVPYGATLVLVTAQVSDDLIEILVRLKRYRGHITLLAVGSAPPVEIPGVRMIHLPWGE